MPNVPSETLLKLRLFSFLRMFATPCGQRAWQAQAALDLEGSTIHLHLDWKEWMTGVNRKRKDSFIPVLGAGLS